MRKFLVALPMVAVLGAGSVLLTGEGDVFARSDVPVATPSPENARAELTPTRETDVPAWMETKVKPKPKPAKSPIKK